MLRPWIDWYGRRLTLFTVHILVSIGYSNPASADSGPGPGLVCCNGAVPHFQGQQRSPYQNLTFRPFNSTSSSSGGCILYIGHLSTGLSITVSKEGLSDIGFVCLCQPGSGYGGLKCDQTLSDNSESAAIGQSNNSGFRIFLFIAIVPLSFALLAGVGAFLCRMCFCDCFAIHDSCKKCWSKDPYNLESASDLADEALMDSRRAAYRTNLEQRNHVEGAQNLGHDTVPNGRALCHDPPPTFDQVTSAMNSDTVITVQPKQENHPGRKYSPPPPYSSVVENTSTNNDVATQTV